MKRIFDSTAATAGLLLISPLFLLVALFVMIKMSRPVFFTQHRAGKNEAPFKMIKFRSMTNERDDEGNLLPNNQRKTKFGNFLRSTSLDELPELINVIKGDMSLVGPRPLLLDYLPYYSNEQRKRHKVRPGITGWAQINGRNATNWDDRLSMDVWYVRNRSFFLDLKILAITFIKVFKREGINHSNEQAMPRFDEYVKLKLNDR